MQGIGAPTGFARDAMSETGARLLALAEDNEFQASVEKAGELLASCLRDDHTVFSCGNGGSLCDAMHFAEELSGRFRDDRPPLAATAISDPAHLSCTSNDYGYEHVFSRYLQAHARPGDVLVGLSTSGTSANIIAAARTVKERGGLVVSMTGRPGSQLGVLADVDICVGTTGYADRAQEVHIVAIHSLIQMVEHHLYSAGAA